jgi:hypothetical protein
MHTEEDLLQHVDNFLKKQGLKMTTKQYYEWKKNVEQYARHDTNKKKKYRILADSQFKTKKYQRVIEFAKEDWLVSTDGVIKALRYDPNKIQFVAKVQYKKQAKVMTEQIAVTDDWVIDTYGKEFVNKLMDRAEHSEFIEPVAEDGRTTVLKLDNRIITRVKYIPPKFVHKTDDQGNEHKTEEVYAKGQWRGMMEDGTVLPMPEDMVGDQFGARFVEECKTLGQRKFVYVPVGSCRSSLMTVFPQLICENAPPVKFMQGQVDSCVFSSLASAFIQTDIPDLVRVANILSGKLRQYVGGTQCLTVAKDIVTENVKWLQPQRLPRAFNWENDMNDYMFVLGVIRDTTNTCQHAVTIFRKWIYDSNEPFALPLSQESLDCCTWDIQDGENIDLSSFVNFCDGWIFKETKSKRKKILDMVQQPWGEAR